MIKIIIKYILIGIIQGLTETLPVSSSGHIMIFKYIFNLNGNFDTLAILTNFGSLVAIIILFYNDLKNIINNSFKYIKTKNNYYINSYNYLIKIIISCIPALIIGFIISKLELFSKIENNIKIVGYSLIITSILLFIVRNKKGIKDDNDITIKDAILIGTFQILGLFPGISRSGSTIVGGIASNLKRDTAFKYSFMLYIVISICATVLELTKIKLENALIIPYILATIISFIITLIVTKWFRNIVNNGKLIYFSIYTLLIGLLIIVLC